MDTRYLKTLLHVVESGSFSKAADLLHVTQSAVSQRIRFLEDHLGHKLFDRCGSTLSLTEAGRIVCSGAGEIIARERRLIEDLSRFDGKSHLSLCCTPTFGMAYLPKVLNDFILKNPDMGDLKFIFLQPAQALEKLRNDEFDLAVIEHCGDFDMADLDVYPLPQDELVFISAPKHQLPPSPLPLEALLRYRLYARKDGCSSKNLLISNLEACGKTVDHFKNVVVSDDLRFTIEAVMGGTGVSFISRSLVTTHLESGSLHASYVEGFIHKRCRSVALRKGRGEEPQSKALLQSVFDAFAL